ncbi:MAG: hypothetical protein KF773_07335 [Deltaproteobacteria bacterium]|nr:hypothetical protein [Deltaproteobacteria bacterium]MCW5804624.1 hypothetical protein [Deltaproteobacteria bacterium]
MTRWWCGIVVVAVALAGCATKYTRTTMANAPGHADIAVPPARELGDPETFEPAADPGTSTLAVIPIPSVMLGTGRGNPGTLVTDLNLEVRFEHTSDAGRAPFGKRALAFTAGLVGVHVDDRGGAYGAMFGEVSFRFPSVKGVLPMDIGVGPVVYPADFEAGAQLTVRFPLLALRARYVERSGFEFWAGYQIPIPFLFQRSR